MAKKQSRKEMMKEIKGPDQYQKSFSRMLGWLNENTMVIWAAVIPVFLVMVGIFFWRGYVAKQEQKLVSALGEVHAQFESEGKKADDRRTKLSDQIADINKKIGEIESKAKPATGKDAKNKKPTKLSKSDKDKIAALNKEKGQIEKQQNDIKPDHNESLVRYKEFFSKHADTAQGWMAAFRAASIEIELKNLDAARQTLAELLVKSKKSDFYQVQARFVYVNLLRDAGEHDKALT